MPGEMSNRLTDTLYFFFTLFVFASTFSIALAQISLGISLALFLVIIVRTRYNPFAVSLKYFYGIVGIYVAWLILVSILGATPVRSLILAREDWLFCIVPIGIYLLCFQRYRRNIIFIWSIGVLLLATYGIIQHFTGIYWFKSGELFYAPNLGYRAAGNFSIAITYGNYFATASLFLLGYAVAAGRKELGSRYYLVAAACIVGSLATIFSFGRGAIIAMVASLVVVGFYKGLRIFIGSLTALAVAVAAVVLISPGFGQRFTGELDRDIKGAYEGSRVFIWKNSLKVVADNPIFGVGPGNFRKEYTSYLRPDIPGNRKHAHAHNDPLNLAAVAGLPGALIFCTLWVVLFWYLRRGWSRWRDDPAVAPFILGSLLASVVFFVSSLTEATFADEEVRQLLMFLWAAGLFGWYNQNKPESRKVDPERT